MQGAIFRHHAAAAICAALLLHWPARAYDLSPIVIQLQASGPGAASSVMITNSHKVPIAVEIQLFDRVQNPDGTDTLTPEKGEFIVIPPQMVIAPGSSQSVRVQWTGDPRPARELAYRFVTQQLPIDLERQQSGDRSFDVKVQYRYEAALYVEAPGAQPDVEVTGASQVKEADGSMQVELQLVNKGTRRAILHQPSITLSSAGGGSATLSGDSIKPLSNLNILAGARRNVRLPWPEGLSPGPITAKLQTSYAILR